MSFQTAKLFMDGHGQAVRLPDEFRIKGTEVFIRKEGDKVILSPKPESWDDFFDDDSLQVTSDFMAERKDLPLQERDFF